MINSLTGGLEFQIRETKNDEEFGDLNESFCPVMSTLPIAEKIKLVKEVGFEILKEEELEDLFKRNPMPICYDGFEPSGRMHIAQGLLRAINTNRLTKAGFTFVFWIADWFAQMNNKMGGDLDKIKNLGRYFIEIWKAAGMDMKNVKFLWASEEINKKSKDYWQSVINVARVNNLDRIKRCCQIMGRTENDTLTAAQIMYPCMQCTDIFFLKADITSLGLDQRKVNVLAREYCDDLGLKDKPIIVSHHMMMGLTEETLTKMSKSIPDSAIYMDEPASEVERKIKKAFCPEKKVTENPIFDYIFYLIFPRFGKFNLTRSEKNGGNK